MVLRWMLSYLLPALGFLLALVLVVHLLRERRPPASTMAWLLAIFLVPYVGVPLYLIFGGRKLKKAEERKESLPDLARRSDGGRALIGALPAEPGGVFPPRQGNEVMLLGTGEHAFDDLMEHLEAAEHSIHISTYILGTDAAGRAIMDVLTQKAKQGAEVYLLLDALGCWQVSGRFLADYEAAGGRHARFMPMMHLPFRGRANLRNHRKIVLVDHAYGMLGGMNLAEEYMGPEGDPDRWHDISLAVRGPVLADLYTVFRGDWSFAAGEELPVLDKAPEPVGDAAVQLVPSGPDVPGDALYDAVVTYLFEARERIWITTPYFVPDEMLARALCIAARRGVDVRIVVPDQSNHHLADLVRRSYLRQAQDAAAAVHRFQPGMLHAKLVVADDRAIVGSMNMDVRSFFLNYEVALFVHEREAVSRLACWCENAVSRSETGMKEASGVAELLEGVGRLLAPLL